VSHRPSDVFRELHFASLLTTPQLGIPLFYDKGLQVSLGSCDGSWCLTKQLQWIMNLRWTRRTCTLPSPSRGHDYMKGLTWRRYKPTRRSMWVMEVLGVTHHGLTSSSVSFSLLNGEKTELWHWLVHGESETSLMLTIWAFW
jgi:hypothetical protein